MEFIEYIDLTTNMSLQNFTDTLELVVYPQCMVSFDISI
jgi:hypothetical protein